MDRVLLDNNATFLSRFAAPSVSSGRFVAAIVDSNAETVRNAFSDFKTILVHNMDNLYSDKVYTGYFGIHDLRENDGEIIIVLNKGGENADQ